MRFLKTVTFFILFAFIYAVPNIASAVGCQQTQVVYSNGVFNTPDDAEDSRAILEEKLLIQLQTSQLLQEIMPVALAYASDGGATPLGLGGPVAGFLGQFLELYLQKTVVDNTNNFWHWLSGTGSVPAPQWFLDGMKQIAASVNAANYVFDPDLQGQVSAYTQYLQNGSRVVIVAHSQGNFYANSAYRMLTKGANRWQRQHVGIVAVATPSGIVEGGGLHVTAAEDWVITAVSALSVGYVLPANSGNTPRPPGADWLNHNFLRTYMAGLNTRTAILSGIVSTASGLRHPSFWFPKAGGALAKLPPAVFSLSQRTGQITCNQAGTIGIRTTVQIDRSSGPLRRYAVNPKVAIDARSVDGTILPSFISTIPAQGIFNGFVPVPNGVAFLFWDSYPTLNTFFDSVGNDSATTSNIGKVSLVSYLFDQKTGNWHVQSSSLSFPAYTLNLDNPFGSLLGNVSNAPPPNLSLIPAATGYTRKLSLVSKLYDRGGGYQSGIYQTVRAYVGRLNNDLTRGLQLPWVKVIVDHGILGGLSSGMVPVSPFGINNGITWVNPPSLDLGIPSFAPLRGRSAKMSIRFNLYNDQWWNGYIFSVN